jgi:Protein of unknown function (DUF935)
MPPPIASYVSRYSRLPSQTPASNGTPAPAPRPTPGQFAEKVRSWVAAGRVSFLPWLDPYTEETEQMRRMYPVMLRHGVVKQALLTKVHSVAALDLQTTPASYTTRDREVAEFVRYAYTTSIEGRFISLAEEVLLPALINKHSISEKVWYEGLWERGRWRGKRMLRCVKAKEHARLVQDEFRNVTGVQSYGFNNVNQDPWPASDFVIFKNLALFQGPGMSDLRAAYKHLWELDTVEKLHTIYLDQFGRPKVHATYADNFTILPDPTKGTDGLPGLETDLQEFGNRGWFLTPDSVKMEALSLATQSQADHLAFCKDRREQIAISIDAAFLHMMTAQQGRGEMRGNSQTQQNNKDLLVWALAEQLCAVLDTQLTPDLVKLNFDGADYPRISLGGLDYTELKNGMDLEMNAQKMGFKLSRTAFARKYNLQEAETEGDVLAPAAPQFPGLTQPAQQPPPNGLPGMQFSDRHGRTRRRKRRPGGDDDDETQAFCGGPGSGRPGPCPTGRKGRAGGHLARAAGEVLAAHPRPAALPQEAFTTPGLGRPDLPARDPRLAALAAARGENARAFFDHHTARLSHDLLTQPPPALVGLPAEGEAPGRMVARSKAALDRAGVDYGNVVTLAVPEHRSRLAAAHPEGGAVVDAARAEAFRRYAASRGRAEQVVARVPQGPQRRRADRELAKLPRPVTTRQSFGDGTQTFCGGPGSGVPGPCPTGRQDDAAGGADAAAPDDAAQAHADAMNNDPQSYSAADVEDVNGQLANEGSDYQIVPDGQGGFEPMTNADADAQHGQGWAVYDDPETGYPAAGPSGYEGDLWQAYAEDPDALERVSEAMNRRLDRVTPEEIDGANEQLDGNGSDFRLGVDGQGRTLLYHVDDLADDFPDGFTIGKSGGKLTMEGA